MPELNDKSVVYIGGYGRNGSTILGIVLGDHPRLVDVGELHDLVRTAIGRPLSCSCGAPVQDCEVWADFAKLADENAAAATRQTDYLARWPQAFLPATLKAAYRDYWDRILNQINTAFDGRIAIDGSKSAYRGTWRALALNRLPGRRVFYIHLVRDARDVMASRLKGNNMLLARGEPGAERFAALKGLIGWIIVNLTSLLTVLRLGPRQAYILRYEDFVQDPAAALSGLGRFLGLDLSAQSDKILAGEAFATGHIIAGNRLAQRKQVTVRPPKRDIGKLGAHLLLLYYLLAWPVDRLIGLCLARQRRRTAQGKQRG